MLIHEIESCLSNFSDVRKLHLVIDGVDFDYDIDTSDVEPIIRVSTQNGL